MPTTRPIARLFAWLLLWPAVAVAQGLLGGAQQDEFLHPDQAFVLSAGSSDAGSAEIDWVIADGYYLYRHRLAVKTKAPGVTVGELRIPDGKRKTDEFFGDVEVYYQALQVGVPLAGAAPGSTLALDVTYQGCADAGLCYPPITKTVEITVGPVGGAATGAGGPPLAEQDRLARLVTTGNLGLVIATFFGLGLLLAFTPCVLPMIPILSGIIAGQGAAATPRRSFLLALTYVLGMALTYTVAGAAFAAAGQQAQSFFQQPWIIVTFALMFVALALAMFGVYELQLPASLQTRLAAASGKQKSGTFVGTFVMGALSALVVTACVAPPLVAALAVIGQTGDVARGALALFALAFGMGSPLLLVGAAGGRLLPKAGPWMNTVKALFGVAFLGVAVWMLERILPGPLTLGLWALLAIVSGWYIAGFGHTPAGAGPARHVARGVGVFGLIYGTLLLAGALAGASDPLRPLAGLAFGGGGGAKVAELPFRKIKTVADLDRELAAASAAGQPVMLDFYADWCVSCKEMEKYTFAKPEVQADLGGYVLLKADVTANDAEDQALLKRFGIFGPPTTAFFAPRGGECKNHRLVGFVAAEPFRQHLQSLATQCVTA